MTKTYNISTYGGKETYSVTLNDTGVVSAEGISEAATEELRASVSRLMARYKIAPVSALDRVVGSYSTLSEADDGPVTGESSEDVVS